MNVFNMPKECRAILFDIDSTLYTNAGYAQSQIDLPVERLAGKRGVSADAMRAEIAEYREKWASEHNGQGISLANIFTAFGVSIMESVVWREELCRPEEYLGKDKRLRTALKKLGHCFTLAALTNNPVSVADRTLVALGVEDLFHAIIGLDTCGVSKPHEEPLMRAAILCSAEPRYCVSVGDRYDIDISLPLEMGMGGILVDGVKDVYDLPDLFSVQGV